MRARRFAIRVCLAMLTALLSGCGSTGKIISEHRKAHDEEISAFLFSADYKKLILVGHDYHYVVDISPQLEGILKATWRSSVVLRAIEIDATDNPKVWVTVYLMIPQNLDSEQDRRQAASMGFVSAVEDRSLWLHKISLKGTRYSAANLKTIPQMKSVSVSYTAKVSEGLSTQTKALLTPLTVAADGALLIVGAPVLAAWGICGDRGCVK